MNLFLVFTEKNNLFKQMNKYKKIEKNKNETILIYKLSITQNAYICKNLNCKNRMF